MGSLRYILLGMSQIKINIPKTVWYARMSKGRNGKNMSYIPSIYNGRITASNSTHK